MSERQAPTQCEACGRAIRQQPGAHRPRRFCGATCRSRAYRARWPELYSLLIAGDAAAPELTDAELSLPANSDEAAALVTREAHLLAARLELAADRARPAFRVQLRRMAAALAESLAGPTETASATDGVGSTQQAVTMSPR